MITGIGTDIVAIARVEKALQRFGERFIRRVFTPREIRDAGRRGDATRFFALRFAAKEAAWKALSPRRGLGIGWQDFEITSSDEGAPRLVLRAKARDVFAARLSGKKIDAHLSLCDDGGFALAFVVLSAS